jgi:uncharacterized protein (TIGR02147 family)
MSTNLPSIYEYNDFRKFIADFQKAKSEQEPAYTKSRMSQLLGLPNSRSYLSDIMKGKNVSNTFIERFIHLFSFNQEEGNFFRMLVKFNQAENPDERELYFEQLIALNKTPKKFLYEQSYRYYKHWYNSAIRALLNVYNFDGTDYSVLAETIVPSITVPQAKQAIKLLLKLDLIKKNEQGFYKPTASAISTEEFIRSEVLKQFQIKSLELAKRAILDDAMKAKILATNTISISKRGQKRIEKQIDRFRSQIRSIVHKDEDPPETIYQIDVLFFPMMR